jgi:hypothetical protein
MLLEVRKQQQTPNKIKKQQSLQQGQNNDKQCCLWFCGC